MEAESHLCSQLVKSGFTWLTLYTTDYALIRILLQWVNKEVSPFFFSHKLLQNKKVYLLHAQLVFPHVLSLWIKSGITDTLQSLDGKCCGFFTDI